MKRFALSVPVTSIFLLLPAGALAEGRCGDVVGSVVNQVTAADALQVLRAAVHAVDCDLCLCDVNDSKSTTASDALAVLRRAVGQEMEFLCPTCEDAAAANAFAIAVEGVFAGAMNTAAGEIELSSVGRAASGFSCTPTSGTVITCSCPNGGSASVVINTTENTTTQCQGGPLVKSHTEQDFSVTFSGCSVPACSQAMTITSTSAVAGSISYDTNQCTGVTTRVATIETSSSCSGTTTTPTSAGGVAVPSGTSGMTVSIGGGTTTTTTTSGTACAGGRSFLFASLEDLAQSTACRPGANCLNITGNWFQSYVCYDSVSNTCERSDYSDFVITQPDCGQVDSDVLDVFSGTLAGNIVQWSASEDVSPSGPSSGDYDEDGTWTFSDEDNFTSVSQFSYTQQNVGLGGPCRANARKNLAPDPVSCGSICNGASNKQFICP